MRSNLFKGAFIASTLLMASIANADLVKSDFNTVGDNLVITDTVTGVEYLDLSLTSGMSVSDVRNLMVEGGIFDGYQVATYNVMQDLMQSLFPLAYDILLSKTIEGELYNPYAVNTLSEPTAEAYEVYVDFRNTFGFSPNPVTSNPVTYGLFDDGVEGSDLNLMSGVQRYGTSSESVFINHYSPSYGAGVYRDDYRSVIYSVWVVKSVTVTAYNIENDVSSASDVGVPFMLGGLLLLGLGLVTRKQ